MFLDTFKSLLPVDPSSPWSLRERMLSQSGVTFWVTIFGRFSDRKELILASLNGKVQGGVYIFPATTLQIPALWPTGAGELSGSDP